MRTLGNSFSEDKEKFCIRTVLGEILTLLSEKFIEKRISSLFECVLIPTRPICEFSSEIFQSVKKHRERLTEFKRLCQSRNRFSNTAHEKFRRKNAHRSLLEICSYFIEKFLKIKAAENISVLKHSVHVLIKTYKRRIICDCFRIIRVNNHNVIRRNIGNLLISELRGP